MNNNKLVMVIDLNIMNPPTKLAQGNQIKAAMTGNPNFTDPIPDMGTFGTNLSNLDTAITAAKKGDVASVAAMHAAEDEVDMDLRMLCSYVQYRSRNNEAVALTSGFRVRRPRNNTAKTFTAKTGELSGVVELATKSEGNVAYMWQYTTDPIGSVVWTDAKSTLQASRTVSGLTPLTTYWFRVAILNKSGQQNWSDPYHVTVL